MKRKMGDKNVDHVKILYYIVVFYVLLLSGSVIQYSAMSELGNINSVLTIIIGITYLIRHRNKIGKIKKNISDLFIMCGGLGLLIIIIIWNNFSFLVGYINTYCLILMPWLICKIVKFDEFINAYIKFMFFLAVVSLILYEMPDLLAVLPIKIDVITSRWDYNYYIFYATFKEQIYDVFKRNIGMFWEPGMYQGFVVFAMMYVAAKGNSLKNIIIYEAVMFATILTIQSSTGFILMFPIIIIIILNIVPPEWKKLQIVVSVIAIAAVLFLLLNPDFIISVLEGVAPGIANKIRVDDNGGSMGTRFYGLLIDVYLTIKHPLGIGMLQIDTYRDNVAGLFRYIVDGSNINTTFSMMLYYGIVPGILYLILMIKGCFNFFDKKLVAILAIMVLLIIINTEPHYMTLFFTVIFMYFEQYKRINVNNPVSVST